MDGRDLDGVHALEAGTFESEDGCLSPGRRCGEAVLLFGFGRRHASTADYQGTRTNRRFVLVQ